MAAAAQLLSYFLETITFTVVSQIITGRPKLGSHRDFAKASPIDNMGDHQHEKHMQTVQEKERPISDQWSVERPILQQQ